MGKPGHIHSQPLKQSSHSQSHAGTSRGGSGDPHHHPWMGCGDHRCGLLALEKAEPLSKGMMRLPRAIGLEVFKFVAMSWHRACAEPGTSTPRTCD